MKAQAWTDGRGNAGTGACACVIMLETGAEFEFAEKLEPCSNNIAEYRGVILALEKAFTLQVSHLAIFSDSKLIVHQTQGQWRIKQSSLIPLRDKVWELGTLFESVDIDWIPREENTKPDRLCRQVDPRGNRRPRPMRN